MHITPTKSRQKRMMTIKTILLIIILTTPSVVLAEGPYDNKYCKDPVELQKWANILEKNPDSDTIAGFHALWIGLCVKVEAQTLTTERAQTIFENFKWRIIESIKAQEEKSEKEAT